MGAKSLEVFGIRDIANEVGRDGNHKLLLKLSFLDPPIPSKLVGGARVFDSAGKDELKRRLANWDARPRLNRILKPA